jgi:hypothetical protein
MAAIVVLSSKYSLFPLLHNSFSLYQQTFRLSADKLPFSLKATNGTPFGIVLVLHDRLFFLSTTAIILPFFVRM